MAAATGLPAEEIQQRPISGCLYTWGDGTVHIRWRNLTAEFSGKNAGEDWIDPALTADYGRRIVANIGEI